VALNRYILASSKVVFLKVLEEESEGDGLFSVIGDSERGGSLDLDGVTFGIVFAVSEPFSEFLTGVDGENWDGGALGESLLK
jgi:hypothetical protein